MKKNLLYLFITCFPLLGLAQQDIHFSQFFAAPLTYNPAVAGAFEGDVRLLTNYRQQWSSIGTPYTTMGFSGDMPVKLTPNAYDLDFLGVGISVYNDNAGTLGYNTFNAAGSVSYALDMGGTDLNPSFLSVGLQFGFIQRSLNLDNADWENQWAGIGFDPSMDSGESLGGTISESNLDLGGGVAWYNSINDYTRLLIGASVLHANGPKIDILGDEESLLRKYAFHGSMAISLPESNVTYLPNVLVILQGPNRIIDVGSEIEFSLWERTEFTDFRNNLSTNIGAYYRYKDAVYLIGRVNYYDFSIGLSYDFTTSTLSEGNNGAGGMEVVVGYKASFSGPGTHRQKLKNSRGL